MKKTILILTAIAAITFSACNGNDSSKDNSMGMSHDSMPMPMQQNTDVPKDVKVVAITFSSIDPAVAGYIKTLVTDYLAVKNALVNNNEAAASAASGKIFSAMKSFDKSLLSAEQKKVYDDVESDLREHAEHIAKNKIDHQRDHFVMMSQDIYNLVKAYGAGMILYHDYCPMYKDGSMWLSEIKDIRNPYYGDKMMSCGTAMEMFK